ncbi:VWA domain-containing protein [Candidatus Woesearchaeota archaeon]|nr:VWA domain-containing protein [Candidatus Woesearchaeota archaeon]
MELFIGSMTGLYALLILVPFILLYLIRPRPQQMDIPSLMFFMTSRFKDKKRSFLKRFTRDYLFFIQLLIFLALAFSVADPFTKVKQDVASDNTILVLDLSASSQVDEGVKSRFGKTIDKAKTVLGEKNTVIIVKDTPLLAMQGEKRGQVIDFLNSLEPTDTGSSIRDAIILAGETLAAEEGRVIVISDFIDTTGKSPLTAKNLLESRGIIVDFVDVGTERNNIGIIDVEADEERTSLLIRNYMDDDRTVQFEINGQGKSIEIEGNSAEPYSFETLQGITKIELKVNDDFEVDNIAYVSAPVREKIKTLLITNTPSIFVKNGLLAANEVDLTIAEPPIVPKEDFDVYVFHDIDPEKTIIGTFQEIEDKSDAGASLIIHVQDGIVDLDYKKLLPVYVEGTEIGAAINVDQTNRFTRNIDFGDVGEYLKVKNREESVSIASVAGNPIISFMQKGDGKVIYYGIPEDTSDFKLSPSYPIFWTNLLRFLTGQQDVKGLNYQVGDILILEKEQNIKTPVKQITTKNLLLDKAGIYELENKNIAVNLKNEKESNINIEKEIGQKAEKYTLKPVEEEVDFSFEIPLLVFACIVLFFELFYIKVRGDI